MTPDERRIYTPHEQEICKDGKEALTILKMFEFIFGGVYPKSFEEEDVE